jgi:hypothetical protein
MDLLNAMKQIVNTFTSIGYKVHTEFNREYDYQEYAFYRSFPDGKKRLHFKIQINTEAIMYDKVGQFMNGPKGRPFDRNAHIKWVVSCIQGLAEANRKS